MVRWHKASSQTPRRSYKGWKGHNRDVYPVDLLPLPTQTEKRKLAPQDARSELASNKKFKSSSPEMSEVACLAEMAAVVAEQTALQEVPQTDSKIVHL